MFDSLRDSLNSAFKSLAGRGVLTEANMRSGLDLVKQSLLEADVNYEVVNDFMAKVGEKALGEKVLGHLRPADQLVGIVHDELVEILGPVDSSLHLKKEATVLMLCGLQGSGKTTTCGKLAKLLLENKVKPLLVAADVKRPAAIEQLHVLGEQLGVPVYSERGATDAATAAIDPVQVCVAGVKKAKELGTPVVILDTAGRLSIDRELMAELKRIDAKVSPDQAYLVVDGMTGQDAVQTARAFNDALDLDGVIMTKLDGDARGGALLSVKHVTGVPIKFIGTGETLDALEPFTPEGMAGRILGLGDIRQLVTEVRRAVDEKQQAEIEAKLAKGQFTLEDMKKQLESVAKPGLVQKMMGLLPGMGELTKMMSGVDTQGQVTRMIGIINGMTPEERKRPELINPSRRNRIARGSGVPVGEVNSLLQQYGMAKTLATGMAGAGMGERIGMLRDLQRSGLMQPGGGMPNFKKGTGKRLTPAERAKKQKELERLKRKIKRDNKQKPGGSDAVKASGRDEDDNDSMAGAKKR